MGCFSPEPLWLKSLKVTPRPGHTRVGVNYPTLYPLSTNLLEALCNLGPSDSPASWSHGVAKWAQDAKIGNIDRLGRSSRVGNRVVLLDPSNNTRALIVASPTCIGVWHAVTLARCCSPRGWSHDMAQDSNICKMAKHGDRRTLYISKHVEGANTKTNGDRPLVICYKI